MPPQPYTTTVEPGLTCARFMTEPSAGHHAAAHQADHFQRRVLADRDDADVRHGRHLGVGAQLEVLVDVLVALLEAAGAIVEQVARLVAQVAQVRPADGAVPAASARRDVRGQDVIANLHAADVRTNRLDDAGALVSEHHRRRVRHDAPGCGADRCGRRHWRRSERGPRVLSAPPGRASRSRAP